MTAFTQTPTDPAGLVDSGFAAQFVGASTNDTGMVDAAVEFLVKGVLPTDGSGLADGIVLSRVTSPTDTSGLADSLVLSRGVATTDTTGSADPVTLATGRVSVDPLGPTDSGTVFGLVGVSTDSGGITESLTYDYGKVRTNPLGPTDTGLTLAQAVLLNYSAGITDSVSFAIGQSLSFTDGAALTDTTVFAHDYRQASTDGLGITDVGTLLAITGISVDVAGITDSVTPDLRVGGQVVPDVAGVTDIQFQADVADTLDEDSGLMDVVGLSWSRIFSDSTGLVNTLGVNRIVPVTPSDTAGITDVVSMLSFLAVAPVDSTGLFDTVNISVAVGAGMDTLNLTDDMGLSVTTAFNDRVRISDDATAVRVLGLAFNDFAGVQEDVNLRALPFLVFNESMGTTDQVLMQRTLGFLDVAGLGDALDYIEAFSDRAGMTDSLLKAVTRANTDAMGISDLSSRDQISQFDDSEALNDLIVSTQKPTVGDVSGLADDFLVDHVIQVLPNDPISIRDSLSRDVMKGLLNDVAISDGILVDQSPIRDDDSGINDTVAISLKDSRLSGTWSFT